MNDKITRYHYDCFDNLTPGDDGEYVDYDDYEKLQAENTILKEERDRLLDIKHQRPKSIQCLQEEVAELKGGLAIAVTINEDNMKRIKELKEYNETLKDDLESQVRHSVKLCEEIAELKERDKRSTELLQEALKCQNNDCKCREGFGLCNQCKEAISEHIKGDK